MTRRYVHIWHLLYNGIKTEEVSEDTAACIVIDSYAPPWQKEEAITKFKNAKNGETFKASSGSSIIMVLLDETAKQA